MKKAIPLSAIALIVCMASVLPVDVLAQNTKGFLIVRVFESFHKPYNKIVVTENGTQVEEIALQQFHDKDLSSAQIETNKVLDRYVGKGYGLINMTSGSSSVNAGILVTTYLFRKE